MKLLGLVRVKAFQVVQLLVEALFFLVQLPFVMLQLLFLVKLRVLGDLFESASFFSRRRSMSRCLRYLTRLGFLIELFSGFLMNSVLAAQLRILGEIFSGFFGLLDEFARAG